MNKEQAEARLRTAAVEFTKGLTAPILDAKDTAGLRRNRKLIRAASTLAGMTKKRGYSRAFTPQTERRVRFEIDRIPPTLYDRVLAKAKQEGLSLRALTLTLWKEWVEK